MDILHIVLSSKRSYTWVGKPVSGGRTYRRQYGTGGSMRTSHRRQAYLMPSTLAYRE